MSTEDELFLLKKKKKKSTKTVAADEAAPAGASADAVADELADLTLKKKKKKKSAAKTLDDFEKQLAEAGVEQQHTVIDFIPYEELLSRFYTILKEKNPELAGGQQSKLKIPPPNVQRDGSKKTAFANIYQISQVLQRNPEHLVQYLFAELGTSGSIDGEKRLIIKGRYQPKHIEGVLRKYIQEYVICKTCKSMNTELKRESANRLHFIVCKACGSTKSVSSIRTGFTANVGAMKKKRV